LETKDTVCYEVLSFIQHVLRSRGLEKLYSRLAGNHCCKSRVATGTVFLQRVGKYNIKVLSRRRLIDCDQNTHRSHRTVSVQKLAVLLLCYQYSR